MPEDYDPAGIIKPKPTVGQQIREGLFTRNPIMVIGPAAEYLRDQAAPYVTFPITGIPPGGGKPTTIPAAQKKILDEVGGLLLPSRYLKAITELGEGSIPFVDRSGNFAGLGSGEEQVLNAERARAALRPFNPPVPGRFFALAGGSSALGVNLAGATPIFGAISAVAAEDASSVLNNMRKGNVGEGSDNVPGLVAQTGDP